MQNTDLYHEYIEKKKGLLAVGTIFNWASTVSCDVYFAHYQFLCRPIFFAMNFIFNTTDQSGKMFAMKYFGTGNKAEIR